MGRARTLLILVAVLAALGAYIYFVESKKPQGAEATAGPKVFAVKPDDIEEITVKAAGGDKTTLNKIGGAWQVTAPITAAADEAAASGIVSNLATVDQMRVVEENPGDLKPFGLAEPRVDVGFRTKGSKTLQHLLIGD